MLFAANFDVIVVFVTGIFTMIEVLSAQFKDAEHLIDWLHTDRRG